MMRSILSSAPMAFFLVALLSSCCPSLCMNKPQAAIAAPPTVVHFHTDQDAVISAEQALLDQIAAWYNSVDGGRVMLEGHADERASDDYNMDLSARRATWVRSYLNARGVPADKVTTVPYGESSPLDPRSDPQAWRKNRRVVFKKVSE